MTCNKEKQPDSVFHFAYREQKKTKRSRIRATFNRRTLNIDECCPILPNTAAKYQTTKEGDIVWEGEELCHNAISRPHAGSQSRDTASLIMIVMNEFSVVILV